MPSAPSKDLLAVPNPSPHRRYRVEIESSEFTCLCPMTGQPDFATIKVVYEPDQKIVELKSLKLYFWSFRQEGHYYEQVTNMILDDLVKALQPHWMRVEGHFNVRGGLTTVVSAEHGQLAST